MSEEVLFGLLPHEYYVHWCTFVRAYRILSKKRVYGWEIDHAERLLRDFYEGVELLYGEDFCTIKVHQLIHTAAVVRNFGPLPNVSSYRYEDINGRIVKMNLAKLSPIEQLHIKFQRINWLRPIIHTMRDANGNEINADHPFITYLRDAIGWDYDDFQKLPHGWSSMCLYPVGYSYRKANIPIEDQEDCIQYTLQQLHLPLHTLTAFNAFNINGSVFHCRDRATFMNDSRWIQFQSDDSILHGELLLGFHDTQETEYLAVVEVSAAKYEDGVLRGSLNEEKQLAIIDIADIIDQCVYVEGTTTYALFPLHSHHYNVQRLSQDELVEPLAHVNEVYNDETYDELYENPVYRHRT